MVSINLNRLGIRVSSDRERLSKKMWLKRLKSETYGVEV